MPRLMPCILLLTALACFVSAPMWAAQATLLADTHVNSAKPTANSGTISNLDAGGGYTTLLQFDLSQLAAGITPAQVSRAVLRLYANRVTTSGTVAIAPVTGAWSEFSVTYATYPGVGGAAATFSVSQAGTFVAVDVTALVQGWVASPATNNGIALTAATAVVQFDSKENDLTAHAATLDVELVDSGPAGPAGATGAAGIVGLNGATGATGLTGAVGPLGPAGTPGATGSQGAKGATGTQGPTGPMGPIGLSGATGAQGPAGTSGGQTTAGLVYQGSYGSTQNYAQGDVVVWQGSSYTSLIVSNHGNTPGLSPQQWGLLSAQGQVGPAGAIGAAGSAGPQGLPGTMGAYGPPGPQGLQGIAGQAGAQGIPGATGVTGLSGPMGPQGFPGPVGITFQGAYFSTTNYAIADGVSYKGAGYVSLVASNHGNTPDQSPQQWALFAAAGAAGAIGPDGATGAIGVTGATGQQGNAGPTGATGATGPQGPPVANYLGNYQSSVNYARDDAVSWQGATFISLAAGNHGNTPDQSPQQWAVLAAQGTAGVNGVAGPIGPVGAAGPIGVTGAAGPQGSPVTFLGGWLIGTNYAVGDAVAYGGSSYIALTGNLGRVPDVSPQSWGLLATAGTAGGTGPQGLRGFDGPTGYAGQVGAAGPPGTAGPIGSAGPTGATGAIGPIGQPGSTGSTGATGANGIPGTNGTSTTGAPGPPGMTFKGAWLSADGYEATDAVTYGGSTYLAEMANSASRPDLYSQVWAVLAQVGSMGPSGPVGISGPAATVSVGAVTTGGAGSLAVVTNSGSSSAAVLNFTIPQGAAGSGGSASPASGIEFLSTYHAVSFNTSYYSVNGPNSSLTELAPVLTWVPNACMATTLNVYSQQANPITVAVRTGAPGNMTDAGLSCTAAPNTQCTATGSVSITAGSFVDLHVTGANGTSAAMWTALACN